jgi:hypothetical protein
MNLSENVAKLASLVPALKANDAKFASDLVASFKNYGSLTPKQEPWIERLIARAVAPVAPVAQAAVSVGSFANVVALFNTAKESGLKFPKVRLSVGGTKVVLSLNGKNSKAPGYVSISGEGTYPNRAYYGRVSPDGAFQPFKSGLTGLVELLTEFSANPARVAKDHGKLTGNCCFCNKVLGLGKEQRSVLVGFGPDCAENYGLKAEWLAAAEKAEAKASVTFPNEAEVNAALAEIAAEPTLTVSPAAQAEIDTLAQSLAQCLGSTKVTVTDGPLTGTSKPWAPGTPNEAADGTPLNTLGQPIVNTDELQAELGPEYAQPALLDSKVCFFCEEASTSTKTLHGIVVCIECCKQLA